MSFEFGDAALVGGARVRDGDSETGAQENTRQSPASGTLEESGRKSKLEARKAEASGVPAYIQDEIGSEGIAQSRREG